MAQWTLWQVQTQGPRSTNALEAEEGWLSVPPNTSTHPARASTRSGLDFTNVRMLRTGSGCLAGSGATDIAGLQLLTSLPLPGSQSTLSTQPATSCPHGRAHAGDTHVRAHRPRARPAPEGHSSIASLWLRPWTVPTCYRPTLWTVARPQWQVCGRGGRPAAAVGCTVLLSPQRRALSRGSAIDHVHRLSAAESLWKGHCGRRMVAPTRPCLLLP